MATSTSSRFGWLLFAPIAAIALILGGVNLSAMYRVLDAHDAEAERLLAALDRLDAASSFRAVLADVHREAVAPLAAPQAGRRTPATPPSRAVLEKRLADAAALLRTGCTDNAQCSRFDGLLAGYRGALSALLASYGGARAEAQTAALTLAEHLAALEAFAQERSTALRNVMQERLVAQHEDFLTAGTRSVAFGAGLIAVLLLLWLVAAHWLTRNLGALSVALRGLARDEQRPVELARVEALAARSNIGMGSLAAAVLTFRDTLRERRETDAALAARLRELQGMNDTQAMLRVVFDEAPDPIEVADAQTLRFVEVNAASHTTLGYTREEMLSLRVTDIQCEGDRSAVADVMRIIETQGRADFEIRHRRKDGSCIDARVHVRTLNRDGRTYLIGIWRDITAVKAARAEADRLSLVVQQSPSAVIITDLDANIRYVNDAFSRHTGYAAKDVLGRNPRFLQSGKTPKTTYEDMWTTLLRGETWRGEFINRTRDGREEIETAAIVPLRDGKGEIYQYVAVKENVTQRKRLERELDEHRSNLERLVAERTSELEAERIRAEAANRSKSEFLANMSHEIRTPMNAIIGLAHLLKRSVADAHQLDQLGKITASAQHLLHIINDILDLSKIEAGKLQLEPSDFDLERVMTNVVDLVRDKAEEKGLELVVDLDLVPDVFHGDGLRLGQILINFAGNAVKFTHAGHVCLRARPAPSDDGRCWVRFEVADSGIGMSNEERLRMFRSFEQADASISRRFGGTGLGLAISRGLVEILGGRIGVQSEQGRGSTFWVEIPFERVTEGGNAQALADFAGRRALVVDDLEAARQASSRMLAKLGMEAQTAEGTQQALAQVVAADSEGRPFDILLVDWHMPGQDGLECGRRLARLPLEKPPRRVLLGMSGDRLPADDLLAAGYYELLPKPLLPTRVRAVVGQVLLGERRATHEWAAGDAERRLRARAAGKRILVAEDNRINQEVALELLRNVGFTVDLAENGAEALAHVLAAGAEGRPYDLVLMDVQMPEVDGLAATRRLRELPAGERLPVLAMTANAFNEDREVCLAAGMNDHVAKPVDPEDLYRALLRWLPELKPDMAAQAGPDPAEGTPQGEGTQLLDRLRAVRGLDAAAGLRRAGGSADLYRRILKRFVEDADDNEIDLAMVKGDTDGARGMAHALKGVAATLGAGRLSQLAAHLEDALARPRSHRAESLTIGVRAVHDEYASLASSIRSALEADGPVGAADRLPATPGGQPASRELREKLAALLACDDLAAAAFHREHAPVFEAMLGKEAARFARHIEDFDFNEASRLLETVAEREAQR